jgi:hypothetical protein
VQSFRVFPMSFENFADWKSCLIEPVKLAANT